MSHAYREFQAAAELSPAVECLWSMEVSEAESKSILPDGCMDLVFRFFKTFASFQWVGVMTRPHVAAMRTGELIVGVRFRPGMLTTMLDIEVSATADASGNLARCADWGLLNLDARLLRSESCEERVDLLQRGLRLKESGGPVQAAIDRLVETDGRATMDELMDVAGVGERQLRRSFQSRVGVAPKRLARIIRFRHALDATRVGGQGRLADIASERGYFDQAHMAKDFQEFGGAPPTAFLGAKSVSY